MKAVLFSLTLKYRVHYYETLYLLNLDPVSSQVYNMTIHTNHFCATQFICCASFIQGNSLHWNIVHIVITVPTLCFYSCTSVAFWGFCDCFPVFCHSGTILSSYIYGLPNLIYFKFNTAEIHSSKNNILFVVST